MIGSTVLMYAGTAAIAGIGIAITYIGMLAVGETIKKTQWFKSLTQSMADNVDSAVDKTSDEALETFRVGLRRHRTFVSANEPVLRRLAGERKELEFLHRALDWLKAQSHE